MEDRTCDIVQPTIDSLVIGGGPAGLTAAIYLARYCRTVLLADSGQSRAALISESHNYPGFMGLSGSELLKRLRSQAEEYGAYIQHSEIRSLNSDTAAFVAWSEVGAIRARTVILASGLVDEAPPVEGMTDAVGGGKIRYCPICEPDPPPVFFGFSFHCRAHRHSSS